MPSLNVDANEIAKFDKMAATWWDEDGHCRLLHKMDPLRLSFILQHTDLKNKNVLDVGCGGGILTESLAKQQSIVTGIDLSQNLLDVASRHAAVNNLQINYLNTSVEELSSKISSIKNENVKNSQNNEKNQFDLITCMELLEHLPHPETAINSISAMLKLGGVAFFSTLNRTPMAFITAIIGAEYVLKELPIGTHNYANFIKPSELNHVAEKCNLKLVTLSGLSFNPLTQTFKLTKNININYLACFIKV